LGANANVSADNLTNATAIGFGAVVNASDKVQIGNASVLSVNTSGALTTGEVTYPKIRGTVGQVLTTDGIGTATWENAAGGGSFVDLTTPQTIGGVKTFSLDAIVNGLTVGKGAGDIPSNTANGQSALQSNTTGFNNAANGYFALGENTVGVFNTAIGSVALQSNTTGNNNTASGMGALNENTMGSDNTANGTFALLRNTTGNSNTANGLAALQSNTTGNFNTANGLFALFSNTTGNGNTANGRQALMANTEGNNNTALGANANVSADNLTNATAIGFGAVVNASDKVQIGNASVLSVNTSGALTTGEVTYPKIRGTVGQVLTTDGIGTATWENAAGGGSFVDLTTPQTIGGVKTFSLDAIVNGLTVGKGAGDIINNTAIGRNALAQNTSGDVNTAIGESALSSNTTGRFNTAIGSGALSQNTTGETNTAIGSSTLINNTIGNHNTAIGYNALVLNTSGNGNTANGYAALEANTTGFDNTANGSAALLRNTEGFRNTANGSYALQINTTGDNNTANGIFALGGNTTGDNNTANGFNALLSNTTGDNNTANGGFALFNNTTGSFNTALGQGADVSTGALTNATAIGFGAVVNASDKVQIGNASVLSVNTSGALTTGEVTYPKIRGTVGQVLTTDGIGTATWVAATSVREEAEEFTATAAQAAFTLAQTPSVNSKVKMYINGIRISNFAYSVTDSILTYNPANNGAYVLTDSDRIQFDYFY